MFLTFKPFIRTALADGLLVPGSPKHMATEMLCRTGKGGRLSLRSPDYIFAVALYAPRRDEKYIYTYCYQKESNWTSYLRNLTPDSYGTADYAFSDSCFFRVCVKRADGADIGEEDIKRAGEILEFFPREEAYEPHPCFAGEIEAAADQVNRLRNEDTVTLCLLADTHYTVNGTFEDTAYHIREVHRRTGFQGIVHLGDLTDGVTSRKVTEEYARRVTDGLLECKVPVYVTPGNHDANYFLNNGEPMDREQQLAAYGGSVPDQKTLYYHVDMGDRLRGIFLSAFDLNRPVRYGFDDEQLAWLKGTLADTEAGKKVIIFCHDAPVASLDYWSFYIWNEEKLMRILEDYQAEEGRHILCFIHGHTHADAICYNYGFPVISVGCAKCEYFTDRKPTGSFTPTRKPDTVSQDLWDVAVVDLKAEKIHLVRFGAGDDREIDCRKKRRPGKEVTEHLTLENSGRADLAAGKRQFPSLWAHRGVSGHAPENTLPAFDLAVRMGCDGVELDVQMTRDGELIVIHDERIDRVSDGQGLVRDFTLKELDAFNFNRSFPAYGRVPAPTLQEVYELLKDTGLLINLELKNSVYFYRGMEEKVLDLAHRMGMEQRILYSSFNHYSIRRLRELDREAKTAFLYSDGFLDIPAYAKKNGVGAVHPSISCLQYPGLMEGCRKEGIRVHVWTVNEREDFKLAAQMGVDAVITNFPERGMETLGQTGVLP